MVSDNEAAARILDKTLVILGEAGENWIQGVNHDWEYDSISEEYREAGPSRCLFGAIADADGILFRFPPEDSPVSDMQDHMSTEADLACRTLAEVKEYDDATEVQNWQDLYSTTWDEVRSLVVKATDRLRGVKLA